MLFFLDRKLQPSDADPLLGWLCFRPKSDAQGTEGPHQTEEGPFPDPSQAGGEVQAGQEQVVLPEAEVLEFVRLGRLFSLRLE